MSAATTGPPVAGGGGGAGSGRGRVIVRGALSLAAVPVFFGALYFAARGGIDLADQQVPPAGVRGVGEVEIGGKWIPKGASGGSLVVADAVQALREHEFQQSLAEPGRVDGVREVVLGAGGWEIEVLSGGDRRFLRVKFAAEGGEGEVFWMRAKDLLAVAEPDGS